MYYGLLNAETKVVEQISKNKFLLEDYEEEELWNTGLPLKTDR